MKAATIALIVSSPAGKHPELVEVLSDDREITLLEAGLSEGEKEPLRKVYEHRSNQEREDSEFADYVEELLTQPFLNPEVQENGVQWLMSKIRIEKYQKSEFEAARIIAQYALKIFADDPGRNDFFLAGPKVHVRVRIFVMGRAKKSRAA